MRRLCIAVVVGFITSSTIGVGGPGGVSAAECTAVDARVLDSDVQFRKSVGLRSDRDYVCSLYENPELAADSRDMGALLTPAELAEMQVRVALEDDASRIEQWFKATPERARAFGGLMIDHHAGGKLVVFIVASPRGSVEDDWRDLAVHPDRLVVRPVERSVSELEALQERIRDALSAGHPLLAHWAGTALDIEGNVIVVEIEPEALDDALRRALIDRFGAGLMVVPGRHGSATLPDTSVDPAVVATTYPRCAGPPCPV